MIVTRFIPFAIYMVLFLSQAEGAEWISAGRSPLGAEFFYDQETMTTLPNGVIKLVAKLTYPEEGKKQFIKYLIRKDPELTRYETFGYTLSSYEMNCAVKEFRITSISNYSSDGQELDSFTYRRQPSEGWLPMPPVSIAETIYHTVCSLQGKQVE